MTNPNSAKTVFTTFCCKTQFSRVYVSLRGEKCSWSVFCDTSFFAIKVISVIVRIKPQHNTFVYVFALIVWKCVIHDEWELRGSIWAKQNIKSEVVKTNNI